MFRVNVVCFLIHLSVSQNDFPKSFCFYRKIGTTHLSQESLDSFVWNGPRCPQRMQVFIALHHLQPVHFRRGNNFRVQLRSWAFHAAFLFTQSSLRNYTDRSTASEELNLQRLILVELLRERLQCDSLAPRILMLLVCKISVMRSSWPRSGRICEHRDFYPNDRVEEIPQDQFQENTKSVSQPGVPHPGTLCPCSY